MREAGVLFADADLEEAGRSGEVVEDLVAHETQHARDLVLHQLVLLDDEVVEDLSEGHVLLALHLLGEVLQAWLRFTVET